VNSFFPVYWWTVGYKEVMFLHNDCVRCSVPALTRTTVGSSIRRALNPRTLSDQLKNKQLTVEFRENSKMGMVPTQWIKRRNEWRARRDSNSRPNCSGGTSDCRRQKRCTANRFRHLPITIARTEEFGDVAEVAESKWPFLVVRHIYGTQVAEVLFLHSPSW